VVIFLESWYRFFPGVEIIVTICFSGGFVAGVAFVNCLELVRCSFEGQTREFTLAMVFAPIDFGILTASLLGLMVEPILRSHCNHLFVDNSELCFTRSSNLQKSISECKGR